ncbi:hypothetical protein QBC47DRAFT_450231 [Echria macrotheca]|uniref:Uncharacterized protein n=1 Tax=Echria macrotheca TaxID=438768 RepID=A0AAJ0BMK9_9PEZI|nr:hypothetical protein QBC47DRAFT_450231 [Echria macrotheca]
MPHITRSWYLSTGPSCGVVPTAHGALWDANFNDVCEKIHAEDIARDPSLANRTTFVCDQDFSQTIPPADYISIDLPRCLSLSPGWEKSRIETPSQWAGPLIGFLVPSLGFIISIPRETTLPQPGRGIGRKWYISLWWAFINLLSLLFDTLWGIAFVFGWAGPYIAGALHETFVDRAILKKVYRNLKDPIHRPSGSEWFALAISLVGSFDPEVRESRNHNTFAELVKQELSQRETARLLLKQSCTQLVPFGVQVGVPLVFYVGASIYSLVDAQARLGDNDTAHSIAFGLWYNTIVLVAITSSMVLSVGAGRVIESVMAKHRLTEKGYKLKSICERRWELWKWSKQRLPNSYGPNAAQVPLNAGYADIFDQHYAKRSALIAVIILVVPWTLAFLVSYLTPEIGVSCRSATVMAYAISQLLLIFLWYFHSSPDVRHKRHNAQALGHTVRRFGYWLLSALYYVVGSISMVVTVAGTIMQLVGVYRNCVCKAGLYYGLPTTPFAAVATAQVKLSTDTQLDRDQAHNWMLLGGCGIIWLVFVCAVAGWHRVRMRQRCLQLIDDLAGIP